MTSWLRDTRGRVYGSGPGTPGLASTSSWGEGGSLGGFDDYALADGPTAGPTGSVSWATHLPTGRAVAVTELAEGARADEAFLARVRLTAAALAGAGAGSPHLLPIREVVEGAGRVWVVEDWVDGRELGEVLADGPLTPEQSVAVACGVLRGLAVAQAHGVVHGAVSPSTVVVTAGGVAQLVGFGFAGLPGLPGVDHARDVMAVATVLGDLLARATSQTRHPKLDEVVGRAMSDKARRGPPRAADLLAALEKAARSDFGRKWEARTSLAPLALARSSAGQPSDPEPPTSSADATRELPPDVTHAVPGEEAATAPVLPAPDLTPVADPTPVAPAAPAAPAVPALPVPAAPDPPAAVRQVWGGGAAPAPAASPATAGDGKGRGRRTRRIQHRVMVRNLAGVILLLLGAGGALAVERVHGSGTRVSAADGPH
ncbi:MAG: eukaryotic-like serine/threonine-protein kinase, partial [Actinomycetota bacterium]|nr:eukaryotic-like serine/threonine-protein kinase [Actinomycetota bacterium]